MLVNTIGFQLKERIYTFPFFYRTIYFFEGLLTISLSIKIRANKHISLASFILKKILVMNYSTSFCRGVCSKSYLNSFLVFSMWNKKLGWLTLTWKPLQLERLLKNPLEPFKYIYSLKSKEDCLTS